ncbi:MAG: hypothetical protein ACOCRO_04390 [Halanaerobiales bacterium]
METAFVNLGAAFSNALGNSLELFGFDLVWGATIGALTFGALLLTSLNSWARNGRYLLHNLTKDYFGEKQLFTNFVFAVIAVVVFSTFR